MVYWGIRISWDTPGDPKQSVRSPRTSEAGSHHPTAARPESAAGTSTVADVTLCAVAVDFYMAIG